MFDLSWLYNQQDQLCTRPKGEEKDYPAPDCSGFVPDPGKDPYFFIRRAIWPDLHKKFYPHIPI